jgi:hypothetical protein
MKETEMVKICMRRVQKREMDAKSFLLILKGFDDGV